MKQEMEMEMEMEKATAAAPATAKTRYEAMMEKAPPMLISITRVNSSERKLDTIYEDTTTAHMTEISFGNSMTRRLLSASWLKTTKPTIIDLHQGGATSA